MKMFPKSVGRQTRFSGPPPSFHSAGLRGFHYVWRVFLAVVGAWASVLTLKLHGSAIANKVVL